MTPPHTIPEGYYYNYVHDASKLYWAARWFELNKSMSERDQALDALIIHRLRDAAKKCLHQAQTGLGTLTGVSAEMQMSKELNIETSKLETSSGGSDSIQP